MRASTAEVHDLLRLALAAHLVEEPAAPANYSVQVAVSTADNRAAPGYHFLFRDMLTVVRSRDVRRVLTGLFSQLSRYVDRDDAGLLEVDAVAVLVDRSALVVPADVRRHLPVIERRLNREGFRVVDHPVVVIDPAGPEVVVPEPVIGVDWSVLDRWSAACVSPHRDPAVKPGRYPLRGWGFGLGPIGELSPARAVTHAGSALLNPHELGPQRALDMLAEVVANVSIQRLWAADPEGLVGPLVELAKQARGAPAVSRQAP